MINYKELLKVHDSNAYRLECNQRPVTINSAVAISPYNTETNMWIAGMTIIIPMTEVLNSRLPIVTDPEDTELNDFLEKNYPKEELK